ncbi:MAG TPA: ATP-binding protein [Pseudolabrys sp.]|nr:ATP-binding protein [Pseudolabrys sp.]
MAENTANGSGLRLLRVAVGASLILPAALFVWAGWSNYQKILALSEERIVRSLDVEQEHATKSFQIGALILDDIIEDLLTEPFGSREQYFHELFKKRIRAVSEIQSIWLFDKDGYPIAISSAYPAPYKRNFADTDYFRAHIEKDNGIYFGEIQESVSGNPPYFTMSRRVTRNGQFDGVLELSMIPGDFYRFYTRLVYGEGLQYGLLREDGSFLVRYPQPITGRPKPLGPTTGFRQTVAQHPDGGFYWSDGPIDGIARRFGIRRLPDTTLYVTAGIASSSMRAQWLDEMFPYFVFGIPGSIFLFITLLFVLHRTKRLHAEMARREAAEGALRQAQRLDAIGQLTGGVAHDFNNLLTIILGNLSSAQRQVAAMSEAARGRLDVSIGRAMQGAQRAATLTRRLLAFSRQQPLNPKALDLNKLLLGLPDLLRGGLGESVSVEVVGAGGLWPVEADATELETAILNLAVNARDAMPNGGKLTIEASNSYLDEDYCRQHAGIRPGQYVQIAVSDTGAGMAEDVRSRAFEPFFTTKEAGQGTGLGLSQVYGFVRQSGGHVKIYSEVGEGTTVKIYLPRLMSGAAEPEQPAPEVPATSSGECILLVEDDNEVRVFLAEALRDANYSVLEAANGEKAIECMQQYKRTIDLMLTDVVMPGMNGRKLAEEAKAMRPQMKVLFMTGYSRNAIVHHGRLDAGVELVQKPISGDQLAAKIRAMLDAK